MRLRRSTGPTCSQPSLKKGVSLKKVSGRFSGYPKKSFLTPVSGLAKGWDRFHFIGAVNYRAPMDHNDGNHILQWDLHFDYEIAPETLPGFFPLFEIHALHYLSNADAMPLSVGGLDYTNLGSSDVAGSSVFWGDLGFRWKLTPNLSIGAAYGFPISTPGNDAFNQRVTFDMVFSF